MCSRLRSGSYQSCRPLSSIAAIQAKSKAFFDTLSSRIAAPRNSSFVKNFGWLFAKGNGAKTSIGTAFVYGSGEIPSWALLGEYGNGSATGKANAEYIWLPTNDGGAIPVGMYSNGKLYAVHPDHLGTPRLITDSAKSVVWQWPYSAFLDNEPSGVLATSGTSIKATKRS